MIKRLLFFVALIAYQSILAQETKIPNKFDYTFEIGNYFSLTQKLPFWQAANKFGSVPKETPAFLCRQSIRSKTDTIERFFKLKYNIEAVSILGKNPQIMFPEANLTFKIGKTELMLGRKKEIFGIVDTLLSSGSVSWSGNSLPIPKIQFTIPYYQRFLFRWLSFKGSFSHGWFGEQTFVKNYYLHQKSLYFRLGKPNAKLLLHAGVVHNVTWGGTPKYQLPPGDDRLKDGKFASDWFVYGNVVFPVKSFWRQYPRYNTYNYFEIGNQFGNHLGSVDLAAEMRIHRAKLMLYKQFIYEDGQLFGLTNTDDGLYGISLQPNNGTAIKKVVFEYLFSKNQGSYVAGIGRLLHLPDRHPNEENFLFNHQQYYDGWSYNKVGIGTPLLTPEEIIRSEKQIGNSFVFVNNNRVWAFYLGILSQVGKINFSNRLSFSRNFGNASGFGKILSPVNQVSFDLNMFVPLPRLKSELNLNLGIDHGDLIKDNFGSYIGIIKKW